MPPLTPHLPDIEPEHENRKLLLNSSENQYIGVSFFDTHLGRCVIYELELIVQLVGSATGKSVSMNAMGRSPAVVLA